MKTFSRIDLVVDTLLSSQQRKALGIFLFSIKARAISSFTQSRLPVQPILDIIPPILPPKTSYREEINNFVTFIFCKNTVDSQSMALWPEGFYCINKRASEFCPAGFDNGAIELNGEDDKPAQSNVGNMVYISSGHDLIIGSYCRRSQHHSASYLMSLPSRSSFSLYRHSGVCQEVVFFITHGSPIDKPRYR